VAQTYEAYGVSYAESRDRFREILDIVERAWTEARFSYEGKCHRFRNAAVVPKLCQKPTPLIRIAASTRGTFPTIGHRGAPIFASVRHTSWSALAEQIRSYHGAWEEAGHPGKGQVFVSAPTYIAETDDRDRSEPKRSIIHFYHEQANLLEGAAKLVDPETAARRMRRVEQLRNVDYDEALGTNALIGSPDAIVQKLRALQAEIGLSEILAELNCGGLIPHDRVVTAMRPMCEAVKPRFAA
jgi:alkanesulfonate monooxygenase SsuD/methylene tetrahydromethanopterin reductase-like flavin-dependent oxidoreductase (luciferase family)